MYAFVTKKKVEFYDTHKEAFDRYEKSKKKIKGVFDIQSRTINPINIGVSFFDKTYGEMRLLLKDELKKEQSEVTSDDRGEDFNLYGYMRTDKEIAKSMRK